MISDWPQQRHFPYSSGRKLAELKQAWDFSRQKILELSSRLDDTAMPPVVACVAVSGSLARMEAHPGSDVDLMIVIDDRTNDIVRAEADSVFATVWKMLDAVEESQPLKAPKPGGVFSQCVFWSTLIDPAVRGIVNEDVTSYGQRMQLLLDAQPIFRQERFGELQVDILHWYSEIRVQQLFQEAGPFHWLWQDVQRYWRSIRARACWLHSEEPAKSLEVNAKLRSSRLTLIAGFLSAIEAAQRGCATLAMDDTVRKLCHSLRRTPLERISNALTIDDARGLLQAYQSVWKFVSKITPKDVAVPAQVLDALAEIRRLTAQIVGDEAHEWLL